MGNLGFQELLIIGVVILVMFGGRKIDRKSTRLNSSH